MKIGIDISQIVYQTGVSRYTVELIKHLLEIDLDNYYYLYAASLRQRPILKAFIKNLDSKKTSSKISYLSPKLLDLFWNRLNLFSPDCCQNLDVFHASNWAIPKTDCKLITTIHDLTFLKYPKTHTQYSIKAHTRHLNKSKKYSDHIITDSYSTKKDLIEYGIKSSKISIIYPAPIELFKKETNLRLIKQTLNKYSLKSPFILSVGTQEPRKNIKKLIKAYQKLQPKYKKLSLVVVGKFGWGDTSKPISGVNLLGFIPDEDLKVLYSVAKVFVYPSLYEGFGFPILEAFKCGCPVITSNISSMPELGGDAAIYINPTSVNSISSAIDNILKFNNSNYQALVKKSLQQSKKFSWKKTAKETLKIYQEVIKC